MRDHLFISYATEDGAIAEWLTRKLTSEGYRVWCDRFKLLGGESYPADIDAAIKTGAFRVLALLSGASLTKPNPTKERTLALNIARERREDFLIPLNVGGLRPTELDWMTSDLTFIPFNPSWADGLSQLLKKLDSISAPKTLANGRETASSTFIFSNPLKAEAESLHTNVLPFLKVPSVIKRFVASRKPSEEEYALQFKAWPTYWTDDKVLLSFHSPPSDLANSFSFRQAGGASWSSVEMIDDIRSENIVSSLLRKSIGAKCAERGLLRADRDVYYFQKGALAQDRISFPGYQDGKIARVQTVGLRTVKKGEERVPYNYHLALSYRIRRFLSDGYSLIIKVRVHLLDAKGEPFPGRTLTARRKKVTQGWHNRHFLLRQLAIAHHLRGEAQTIVVGQNPEEQVICDASFTRFEAPYRIDEELIGKNARADSPDSEDPQLEPDDPTGEELFDDEDDDVDDEDEEG